MEKVFRLFGWEFKRYSEKKTAISKDEIVYITRPNILPNSGSGLASVGSPNGSETWSATTTGPSVGMIYAIDPGQLQRASPLGAVQPNQYVSPQDLIVNEDSDSPDYVQGDGIAEDRGDAVVTDDSHERRKDAKFFSQTAECPECGNAFMIGPKDSEVICPLCKHEFEPPERDLSYGVEAASWRWNGTAASFPTIGNYPGSTYTADRTASEIAVEQSNAYAQASNAYAQAQAHINRAQERNEINIARIQAVDSNGTILSNTPISPATRVVAGDTLDIHYKINVIT